MNFKVNIKSHQALLLSYKMSPREVEKCLRKLGIQASGNLAYVTLSDVRTAAVQVKIRKYETLWDYVSDMNQYVAEAVNQRAQLICFPEFAGLLPLSLIPNFNVLEPIYQREGQRTPEWTGTFDDLLSYFSDFIFDVFHGTMSGLARLHEVFIMAGSSIYFEGTRLHHRAFFFNNTGDLVGYQDKMSLSLLEKDLHIAPATEVKVFETRLGSFSILTGNDEEYPQLARIAKNLGAKVLLGPSSPLQPVPPSPLMPGLGLRSQENRMFGVQPSLAGDTGLGFSLGFGSRIFSPNELLKSKNGILAKSMGARDDEIVSARLDLDALGCLRNPYTQDKNKILGKKYYGGLR